MAKPPVSITDDAYFQEQPETRTGLPVDPASPMFYQMVAPFLPIEYETLRPYEVRSSNIEDMGGFTAYREIPGEYKITGFGTPPIISGGIEAFKKFLEDPTGTTSSFATAVGEELKAYPERQLRTALSGGVSFNPETGEVERFDPFAIPTTVAAGTARSIAKTAGDDGTVLGMIGGRNVSSPEIQARMLDAEKRLAAGEDPDQVFAETSTAYYSYTDPTTGDVVKYLAVELDDAFNQVQLPAMLDEAATGVAMQDRQYLDDLFEATGNNVKPEYGRFIPYSIEDFMGQDHPILQYYPHLKNIRVHAVENMPDDAVLGNWNRANNIININMTYGAGPNQLRSTIMHELQHAIQDFEGLPRGGGSFYPSTFELRRRAETNEFGLNNAINIIENHGFGDLRFGGPYTAANQDTLFLDRYDRLKIADAIEQAQEAVIAEKGGGLAPELVFPGSKAMTSSGSSADLLFKDEVVAKARKSLVNDELDKAERFEKAMATLGIGVSKGPETTSEARSKAYENYRRIAGEAMAKETEGRLELRRPAELLRNIDEKEALLASNPTFPLNTRWGTYTSREELEFGLQDDKDEIMSGRFYRPQGFTTGDVSPDIVEKVEFGDLSLTRIDPTLDPEGMPFRIEDVYRLAQETGAQVLPDSYVEPPFSSPSVNQGISPFGPLLGGRQESRPTVRDFNFYQDNPAVDRPETGKEWLESNIRFTEERYADSDPSMLRGPTTAVLGQGRRYGQSEDAPINDMFLSTDELSQLPGANFETRGPGDPQFDQLLEKIKTEGFDPDQAGNKVVVGVNHMGQAYILEGNTRAAVAKELGIPSLKTEVRYWNGGEMVDGPYKPDAVAARASTESRTTDQGIAPFGPLLGGGLQESRPTDPVTIRSLGGGRGGIYGLVHGSKYAGKEYDVPSDLEGLVFDDPVRVGKPPLAAPVDKLVLDAGAVADIGERRTVLGSELIENFGFSNRIKDAVTKQAAASAEGGRPGFSIGTDPMLSYTQFTGDNYGGDINRLYAVEPQKKGYKATGEFDPETGEPIYELKDITMQDVEDLSPAAYLVEAYNPEKPFSKKPNSAWMESEVHLHEDLSHGMKPRPLSPRERQDALATIEYEKRILSAANNARLDFTLQNNTRTIGDPDVDVVNLDKAFKQLNLAVNTPTPVGAMTQKEVDYTIVDFADMLALPSGLDTTVTRQRIIDNYGPAGENLIAALENYRKKRDITNNESLKNEVFNEASLLKNRLLNDSLTGDAKKFSDFLNINKYSGLNVEIPERYRYRLELLVNARKNNDTAELKRLTDELTSGDYPAWDAVTFIDDDGFLSFKNRRGGAKYMTDEDYDVTATLIQTDNLIPVGVRNLVNRLKNPYMARVPRDKFLEEVNRDIPLGYVDLVMQLFDTRHDRLVKFADGINKEPVARQFNESFNQLKSARQGVADALRDVAAINPIRGTGNLPARIQPSKDLIEASDALIGSKRSLFPGKRAKLIEQAREAVRKANIGPRPGAKLYEEGGAVRGPRIKSGIAGFVPYMVQ